MAVQKGQVSTASAKIGFIARINIQYHAQSRRVWTLMTYGLFICPTWLAHIKSSFNSSRHAQVIGYMNTTNLYLWTCFAFSRILCLTRCYVFLERPIGKRNSDIKLWQHINIFTCQDLVLHLCSTHADIMLALFQFHFLHLCILHRHFSITC